MGPAARRLAPGPARPGVLVPIPDTCPVPFRADRGKRAWGGGERWPLLSLEPFVPCRSSPRPPAPPWCPTARGVGSCGLALAAPPVAPQPGVSGAPSRRAVSLRPASSSASRSCPSSLRGCGFLEALAVGRWGLRGRGGA